MGWFGIGPVTRWLALHDTPVSNHVRHIIDIHKPKTAVEWVLDVLRRFPFLDQTALASQLAKLYVRRVDRYFDDTASGLTKGTLCIDLGAHLGTVSARLVRHGLRVIAFEPDPATFERLKARLGGDPNVQLIEAAAGVFDGVAELVRSPKWTPEGLEGSMASSLLERRPSAQAKNSTKVRVVDFLAFLDSLDEQVGILKIDIEGGEYDLVPSLLKSGYLKKVDHLLVETHEWIDTDKAALVNEWRAIAEKTHHPKMRFDWV